MKITIIAVGKLKERFWVDACAEYLKRLQAYANVHVRELADVDPTKAGGISAAVNKEGTAIVAAIPSSAHVVLLAIEGTQHSSTQLASRIENWSIAGTNDIVFIIGGSDGVSADVAARANETLSFGRITLPHNLARVVLLEQVYRAFKIIKNEPYHK